MKERRSETTTLMKTLIPILAILVAGSTFAPAAEPRMSWLDNGRIRLGVDLSIGGAITHLSTAESHQNMINSHDWGRQIQMSFYSGPVPFVPEGATVNAAWKALGWNPIQSGDCYGYCSQVTQHANDGKVLHVRCTPMQWPLKNVPGECEFECWFRLEGNLVHVRSRLTNHRSDKTQYPGRAQELPAVYTNGEWFRLVSYQGDRPFSGAEPKVLVDLNDGRGWPWRQFYTPEHWAALLDKNNRGLGIYQPAACAFTGGFAGDAKGHGGAKDNPTGYMAPTTGEILDHNIIYTYDYTLIVGSLTEIRDYVYQREKNRTLPRWEFISDRQHWVYENTSDTGWPIKEGLHLRLAAANAALASPKTFWRAEAAPKLLLRAGFTTSATSAKLLLQPYDHLAAGDWAQWGPERAERPAPARPLLIPFKIEGDGRVRTLEIDLSAHPEYCGAMTQIKLLLPPGAGTAVIHAVELNQNGAAAEIRPATLRGESLANPPEVEVARDLVTPVMTDEAPAAGRRVRQVPPEYQGTQVYHALYLPVDWMPGGTWPVMVEYTGNKFPSGQGSGEVKDANLGYGMSSGTGFIWVTMPYVERDHKQGAFTWWGDKQATVDYCKVNLPRICTQFGGDPNNVFLCGFSRGAIGASYIGLADDAIAALWKGVFTHDHFDGQRQWGYPEDDRASALKRLTRLKGRPVLVCGTEAGKVRDDFLKDHLDLARFTFLDVPVATLFKIPEGKVLHPHTDLWMHRDSEYRRQARAWLQDVLKE